MPDIKNRIANSLNVSDSDHVTVLRSSNLFIAEVCHHILGSLSANLQEVSAANGLFEVRNTNPMQCPST